MTDQDYLDRAEALLAGVEATCDHINDATDADIDNQRTGGLITLVFAGGGQIVINLQKPLHEVWLAAPDGGYHYRWHDGDWRDTKGSETFHATLSRCASALAGQALVFGPAAA